MSDILADAGDEATLLPSSASVYEQLRGDIIAGRLRANERLKVNVLAERYGVSTNPVREALQQLRGEGFVVISPNRGARVREVDEDFFSDISEIESLIEPHLTHYFVGIATDADVAQLERIEAEIESLNFSDLDAHNRLDTAFHRTIYDRHHNRHMVDMWQSHREILSAVSRSFPISLNRRAAVLREHRALLDAVRRQDADGAAGVVRQHVEGSARHWVEQMRAARRR